MLRCTSERCLNITVIARRAITVILEKSPTVQAKYKWDKICLIEIDVKAFYDKLPVQIVAQFLTTSYNILLINQGFYCTAR